MSRINDGFSPIELIGILTLAIKSIEEQMLGKDTTPITTIKKSKMKEEAQRILDLFNGDYVFGLRCINELIRETGAKYWYDVRREYEQA